MKKILFTLIICLFLIYGCTQVQVKEDIVESAPGKLLRDTTSSPELESDKFVDWQNVELREVTSLETFKINDFEGMKVLVESFAVWCPTCTRQQKNIEELHRELGNSIVTISLDTDPNEEESVVRDHVQANGFKGMYAVAPKVLTKALIDKFGVGVVNAPSAPVILVCENGNSRLMDRGLKSVEELKEEIAKGC
jgi:thiol-disulfide isomerase/thioredoxin